MKIEKYKKTTDETYDLAKNFLGEPISYNEHDISESYQIGITKNIISYQTFNYLKQFVLDESDILKLMTWYMGQEKQTQEELISLRKKVGIQKNQKFPTRKSMSKKCTCRHSIMDHSLWGINSSSNDKNVEECRICECPKYEFGREYEVKNILHRP